MIRLIRFILSAVRDCDHCNATGQKNGKTCPACGGSGLINTSTV